MAVNDFYAGSYQEPTFRWYKYRTEFLDGKETKKENTMEINKTAAVVYEKTEDALLVSNYESEFGIRGDGNAWSERNLIWLRDNKKEVLKRCKELEAAEEEEE